MLGGANPSHNTRDPNRPKPTKNALVEQHRSPTPLGVPPPTCLARPIRQTTYTSPINRSQPKHIHVEQLHDNALQRCPPCVMVTMSPQHTRRPHRSMASPIRRTTCTSPISRSQPSTHLSSNIAAHQARCYHASPTGIVPCTRSVTLYSEVAAHPACATPPYGGTASTQVGLSEVTAHPASAMPPSEGTTSTHVGCDEPRA